LVTYNPSFLSKFYLKSVPKGAPGFYLLIISYSGNIFCEKILTLYLNIRSENVILIVEKL
jgi:hypothetical protein